MALPNPQRFNTAQEAVQFAIANRVADGNNYDVERVHGGGFASDELHRLLVAVGYRPYERLALRMRVERPGDFAEAWVQLSRPHPKTSEILNDFSQRPLRRPKAHLLAFHQQVNRPVAEYLQSRLLTFEVQQAPPQVYCTAFGGAAFDGRRVGQEDVVADLAVYVGRYLAPLRLETTGKGEFRFDSAGHGSDPDNPHSYPHLHVYHRDRNYHTTIRTA